MSEFAWSLVGTGVLVAATTFALISRFVASNAEGLALSRRELAAATTAEKDGLKGNSNAKRVVGILLLYFVVLLVLAAAEFKIAAVLTVVNIAVALVAIVLTLGSPTRLTKVVELIPMTVGDSVEDRIIKMKANNDAALVVWALVIAAGVPSIAYSAPKAWTATFGLLAGALCGMVFGDHLTRDLQKVYNEKARVAKEADETTSSAATGSSGSKRVWKATVGVVVSTFLVQGLRKQRSR